jgi:hypothetical protein
MKKGMQPTVFIAILVLLLTLMVLEHSTEYKGQKPRSVAQK